MATKTTRDEFPQKVKDDAAKSAGYCCSWCRRGTLRPTEGTDGKYAYIGKAGHIRAASINGPRYDENMSADERKALSNAIFLCSNCHDVVDSKGSEDFYTVELLERRKAYHLQWVRDQFDEIVPQAITVVGGFHEAVGEGEITGFRAVGVPLAFDPSFHSRAEGRGRVTGTELIGGSSSVRTSLRFGSGHGDDLMSVDTRANSTWVCPSCGRREFSGFSINAVVGGPPGFEPTKSCPSCGAAMVRR